MTNYRSPTILLLIGGVALALGAAMWFLNGENILAWALLIIAVPPIFEGAASRQAAQIGGMVYGRYTDEVERLAYRPLGALLRCCYLLCFAAMAVILGRAGYNISPDNIWTVVIIIGPIVLYIAWAGTSYWKSINLVARQERWSGKS
ncbi:hypothetical protein M9979_07405 [Sphingomonas sp. RP10(2022)]|uniref:Uncharacterized protein n=1 Tax=Sphingomonas liriopis TaxID=2949094 RepID=A0A9X2KPG7_9SPHN|nr:hypothetical protein [Sphingomonas liriopis]MCP3734694.1 hypothetical protein [Sphingomonas liriopis]